MHLRTLDRPADRRAVEDRLRTLGPASHRRWGTMELPAMLRHLGEGFRIARGEREAPDLSRPFTRHVLRPLALWVPAPWPRGFRAPYLPGARPPGELPGIDEARDALLEQIDRFVGDGAGAPHPLFGPMPRRDWMRWGWRHCDHHLRQFGA